MKAVQTKTNTSAAQAATSGKPDAPFFSKGGGQEFFHSKTTDQSPFFSNNVTPRVQAKLTVGKPNDHYEKQADAMADKVVQRLSDRAVQKKEVPATKMGPASIQAKCSECEQEDKVQKKEDGKPAPEKVQRKSIFESNDEKNVQRKCDSVPTLQKKQAPAVTRGASGIQAKCNECEQEEKVNLKENDKPKEKLQLKPAPEAKEVKPVQAKAEPAPALTAPSVTPAIQSKCSSCEEEKVQEKEDDTDKDAGPGIQKKPIFESNADKTEDLVQRSCRECEEGDKVMMKADGMVQRDAGETPIGSDGSREAIVAMAKGEIGKVRARENDGTGRRVGADRLLEYFHIAAPDVWPDSIIETAGAEMPSWCGIFSVWAHKKAGKDIGNWEMGKGVSAFGTLTNTSNPQPGDIGYIHKPNQHHAVVVRVEGDTVHTIDGNSGAGSEVKENQKPRSKYDLFMTAFGGGASGSVQKKEEGGDGIVQTKSGDSVASSSVESRISSTKGKGNTLPESTRSGMEQSFGADFSGVKIHTDSNAVQMSRDLHAHAFTHGSDIYFNSGKYDTGSSGGQHLLAHELTHVVQQGSAPSHINRSAVEDGETAEGSEGPAFPEHGPVSPEEMERETQKDLAGDNFNDSTEKGEDEGETPQDTAPPAPEGGDGSDAEPDTDEGPEDAENDVPDKDEADGGDQAAPDGGKGDSVPDGTPAKTTDDKCPQIAPEMPEPPKDSTLPPTEDESFYKEVLDIIANNSLMPGMAILRPFGVAAYFAWKKLPMLVKIKAINWILDQAIAGAYFGRYSNMADILNSKILSAAMIGFFKRIRSMPDTQKVYMFEKFGKIILRGDTNFTLGLLKGILIGFFLDGLLGIIQMVVDFVCVVPKILNFFKSIKDFLSEIPHEVEMILLSIQEFMESLQDLITNAYDELMDFLSNPQRIFEILRNIEESALGVAEKVGASMADGFIRYASLPPAALGEIVGRIGGQLIFEGVLIFFTKGGGAAVTAAKTALRAFGKALSTIGRQIFRLIKLMGSVLKFLRSTINQIIKFLTPLLKVVATLARRVIDKVSALFKTFRRHCKPGSVKCKLPKPKCVGKPVPRLGGFLPHDRYVKRVTGTTKDYNLRTKVLGVPLACNYDAKKGPLLMEGKTGYRYLPFLNKRSKLYRAIMLKFTEQRIRCLGIALKCLHGYTWFMQSKDAATFLNARWKGKPPVLHKP